MAKATFTARSPLPASADEAFAWHERPGAFERLSPPWDPPEIVDRTGGIADGEVTLRLRVGPAPITWRLAHRDYVPGRSFRDVQVEGPFKSWSHEHRLIPRPDGGCDMEDAVEYELPFGFIGRSMQRTLIDRLAQLFTYRHAVLAADLRSHARLPKRPLKVAITGATGMLGRNLAALLSTGGHEVLRLVRPQTQPLRFEIGRAVAWNPADGTLDAAALEGCDALVHLAGRNVAEGRWNEERKRAIRDSRVDVTRALVAGLARLDRPPPVVVSASAIGFYDPSPDGERDESTPVGSGFFPDLVRDWEAACDPLRERGVRVVHPRIGVVLTPEGGALERMLPPFKAGVGGQIGDGTQWLSWIAMDDVLGALLAALGDANLVGPVNLTGPDPATNHTFVRTLAHVLGRPAVVPVPSAGVKLLFGEMGATLLLGGARVLPRALEAAGYPFRFPTLEQALRHELGRQPVKLTGTTAEAVLVSALESPAAAVS